MIGDSFNQRIRRVDRRSSVIETIAGIGEKGASPPGTPALEARFGYFGRMICRPNGDLLFTEWANQRVVRIGADGKLDVVRDAAGMPIEVPGPAGLAVDEEGNLVWTEAKVWDRHGRVRRWQAATGRLTHIAGAAPGS